MTIFNLAPDRVLIRYFLVADDDGWYFIPTTKKEEWLDYLRRRRDGSAWTLPAFVVSLDNPWQYTFADPRQVYK